MENDLLASRQPLNQNYAFGRISLNRPAKLNAFTPEMLHKIVRMIHSWEKDPTICFIWLDSQLESAFCAGGDLMTYYRLLRNGQSDLVLKTLRPLYRKIYALYQNPKPILTWASGWSLGGGASLQQCAAFRLITPDIRFGMPEVGIGYLPDCGVGHALGRLPGGIGILMGVSGHWICARDLLECGLAEACFNLSDKDHLIEELKHGVWYSSPQRNRLTLAYKIEKIQQSLSCTDLDNQSPSIFELAGPLAKLDALDLEWPHYRNAIENMSSSSPWLKNAVLAMQRASPRAMEATYNLLRKAPTTRFSHYRRFEFAACRRQIENGDFATGIKAKLVERTTQPKWSP